MNDELSKGAEELLQYLVKYRRDFREPFRASFACRRTGRGEYLKVRSIKPLLNELVDNGYLTADKGLFTAPRYSLNFNLGFEESENEPEVVEQLKLQEAPKQEQETPEQEEEVSIYNQEYRDALEDEIKKYKRFVITTAVMGKEINKPFVEALRNYARRNQALLLVLPCEDVVRRNKNAEKIEISPELSDFRVVFKDTYLNNNLCLCAIKCSAKQINPLTGLDRLATMRDASIIVASPKVFLRYIPNMHYDIPLAMMTTGAITENNYDNDKYMSKRTSVLAENDHTYGAVIVEIEDENIFHFRHVQASKYNSVTDMGIDYMPNGSQFIVKGAALVIGDTHTGYHDKKLKRAIVTMAQELEVSRVALHDVFNGASISHHDANKNITRAIKAGEDRLCLKEECEKVLEYIRNMQSLNMDVLIVDSNHDKHLLKYLEECRFVGDPVNYKFSLMLALAATEGEDPLKYAIEEVLGYKNKHVTWLETDQSYKIYGVEVGVHGHLGANGSRGSLSIFEKGLGNCVTAHTHSAAIIRNAYCVGTTSDMDLKYNKGLSNWTRTCCLIYPNGTKQLINFIPNKNDDYKCTL